VLACNNLELTAHIYANFWRSLLSHKSFKNVNPNPNLNPNLNLNFNPNRKPQTLHRNSHANST